MKFIPLLFALLVGIAVHAEPPGSSEKIADIKALLAATGHGNLSQREFDKLLEAYQKKLSRVKPETWTVIRKSLVPSGLDNAVAKVYDEHLTHVEIKTALAFYETEAGRKLARVTPSLMDGTARAIADWQRQMTNAINQKLNESVKKEKPD